MADQLSQSTNNNGTSHHDIDITTSNLKKIILSHTDNCLINLINILDPCLSVLFHLFEILLTHIRNV